jgi:hypothetical protein
MVCARAYGDWFVLRDERMTSLMSYQRSRQASAVHGQVDGGDHRGLVRGEEHHRRFSFRDFSDDGET